MSHSTGICLSALGLLVVVGMSPAAGGDGAQAPPIPSVSEQVDVELRQIDFLALDRHGHPVTDLGRHEVRVLVEGRPCRLERFGRLAGPLLAAGVDRGPVAGAVIPQAASFEGRWIVLYFDGSSSAPESLALASAAARDALPGMLRPGDRVSVVVRGDDLRFTVPFTSDQERVQAELANGAGSVAGSRDLKSMIEQARGIAESCRSAADRQGCVTRALGGFLVETERQTAATLGDLEALLRALAPIPDRKLVLWFSDGPLIDPAQVASAIAQHALGSSWVHLASLEAQLRKPSQPDLDRLLDVAERARVSLYPIHVAGRFDTDWLGAEHRAEGAPEMAPRLVDDPLEIASSQVRDAERRLAAGTAGVALFRRNPRNELRSLLDSSDGLYYVAFSPQAPGDVVGRVDIEVARSAVRIVAPRQGRGQGAPERRLGGELLAEPADPRSVRADLRIPGPRFTVRGPSTQTTSEVATYIEVADISGRRLQSQFEVLSLAAAQEPRPEEAVFRRPFALRLPPGDYVLQVRVQDLHGPAWGTYSVPLRVPGSGGSVANP